LRANFRSDDHASICPGIERPTGPCVKQQNVDFGAVVEATSIFASSAHKSRCTLMNRRGRLTPGLGIGTWIIIEGRKFMPMSSGQSAYAPFLWSCLLISTFVTKSQVQREVAPPAKSDRYAVTAEGKKERVQHGEIASANFRISGVDLASDEDVLLQAAKVLGKTQIESSGDAADSKSEVCYRSVTDRDNTHLIFGRGEVDFWFILSSDGSVWEGTHACSRSGKIADDATTDSGLRLGLTEQQVLTVLGLATEKSQDLRRHTEFLTYRLETRKKTDPQKLARWWQQEIKKTPTANHQEFLENYESYTLEVYISARFVDDSLTRLYVSWSAQY